MDTVIRRGYRRRGELVCPLQMIDVKTGWSEREAIMGRGERAT